METDRIKFILNNLVLKGVNCSSLVWEWCARSPLALSYLPFEKVSMSWGSIKCEETVARHQIH